VLTLTIVYKKYLSETERVKKDVFILKRVKLAVSYVCMNTIIQHLGRL